MQANSPFAAPKTPDVLPLRIVCLVPSVTELLFAMGLGAFVVGRTGYCIHPKDGVRAVPKVGGTKSVNLPKIKRLAPTHVVVNVDENEIECVNALSAFVPHVVVTHPQNPRDNLGLIDDLMRDLGLAGSSKIVATNSIDSQTKGLKDQISLGLSGFDGSKWPVRRVLYLIWRDPWMGVARDTYISRMLALAGMQTWPEVNGGLVGAARYPVVDLSDAAAAGVDAVLLSSEPYAFGSEHADAVKRTLPTAKCMLVDGEAISWYGSRCLAGFAEVRRVALALS